MTFSRNEATAFAKGYRVTELGEVLTPRGKVRKVKADHAGYFRFANGSVSVAVHRLQAYQTYGDRIYTPGTQVRHLDGNRLNNSQGNIAIGTSSENAMDKTPETRRRCALIASSKIKKHDHAAIRLFYHANGRKQGLTLQHFGISSKGTLYYIINGRKPTLPTLQRGGGR